MSPSLASQGVDLHVDTFSLDHNNVDSESCPLLPDLQPSVESQIPQVMATPVPKLQLATLCLVRLLEPIGFTQLFPYINEMLVRYEMVKDPSRVGFVSGLVESAFSVFQMLSIYHWAKLSDTVGRRPIVLGGVVGMALMTFLFGLSHTLPSLLITRSLNGFFAGNIAVVQSVVGDISDVSNQAITFPIYAMIWPLGSVLGPLLGGTFSDPAARYPQFFDYRFFRANPYFLPCCVATVISCIGATVGYFLLEETLPSKRKLSNLPSRSYGAVKGYGSPDSHPVSVKALLSIPIIRALSLSGFALSFISAAYDTVFVLFCYTPLDLGGLAFTASEIGYALAMSGATSILMQMFLMPILIRKSNHARTYHKCMLGWSIPFIVLPCLNSLAKHGVGESGQILSTTKVAVWIGIAISIFSSRLCCLAFSFSMLLVKDNLPSPYWLGAANGLINVAMSFARVFSPAFSNSAFAASVELDIMNGYFWVVIIVMVAFLGSICSARIVAESQKL